MRIVYHLISYGYGINKSHRNLGALVSLWLEEYNQSFFSDQTGRSRLYETTPKWYNYMRINPAARAIFRCPPKAAAAPSTSVVCSPKNSRARPYLSAISCPAMMVMDLSCG